MVSAASHTLVRVEFICLVSPFMDLRPVSRRRDLQYTIIKRCTPEQSRSGRCGWHKDIRSRSIRHDEGCEQAKPNQIKPADAALQ